MSKANTGLKSRYMLRAVALFNEDKRNPEISTELGIGLSQVAYLLNQARKDGFRLERNYSKKERENRKIRGIA